MKVNWRKFGTTFLFLYTLFLLVTVASGCAGVLDVISGLLPGLGAAFMAAVSFIKSLEGKTVPADLSAKVQQWGSNIAGFIANIQTIIAAAAGKASAGVIAQIQAVMQQIESSTSSILSEFNVTDSATVSKFTSLVGLGVSLVMTILGLFGVATKLVNREGVTDDQLKAEAAEAEAHVKNAHKAMQDGYKIVRNTATSNADVNAALAALPAELP